MYDYSNKSGKKKKKTKTRVKVKETDLAWKSQN